MRRSISRRRDNRRRVMEIGRGHEAIDDLRSTETREPGQPSSEELPLWRLVAEDLATYDMRLLEPGLWAVLVHRLGRRARGSRFAPFRRATAPLHAALATAVDWLWGIDLPTAVALGRRVRIWHNGATSLHARAIGDDVHIHHDTTLGSLRADQHRSDALPTIESGVRIESGVSILGAITVGRNAVVRANSVVLRHVAPDTVVCGVPARLVSS